MLLIRHLGLCPYRPVWQAMQQFTSERQADTPDELWILEHTPVYTQGLNGKAEHVLAPRNIPVIKIDRGGQVTYHGPGQLIIYCLLDLRRLDLGVRALVTLLENAIIELLAQYQITAYSRADAPGVYVNGCKLASLGLRVRRGCSYHGLSLNIDMDLSPFQGINPCGYQGLEMTQTSALTNQITLASAAQQLSQALTAALGYHSVSHSSALPPHYLEEE